MYLGCTLSFQEEWKNIVRKMAAGIKTLKCSSCPFTEQTRLLLMNALVISHLHFSVLLLASSKKLLRYFGETIKLGCEDVLQSQDELQDNASFDLKPKRSHSPSIVFLGIQSTKLFYETYRKKFPIFEILHLPTSNLWNLTF